MDHTKSIAEMSASRQVEMAEAAAEYQRRCAAKPHALELLRLLERAMPWVPPHNPLYDEISDIITKVGNE